MDDLDELRTTYKSLGYALLHYDESPIHSYPYDAPWLLDDQFETFYEAIRRNTLVDRPRCYSLYELAQQVRDVEGDILEVGTWRGGTAGLLAQICPNKTVYVADTFEGVVKSSPWEHYVDKAHDDTSEQLVTDFFEHDLGISNFTILKGIFPEDTGDLILAAKLALVYLDVDVYLSTKDAFEFVWPHVVPGGIVVFDDYGMLSACEGISRFVNEIKHDADKLFISNTNGQAYIIRT